MLASLISNGRNVRFLHFSRGTGSVRSETGPAARRNRASQFRAPSRLPSSRSYGTKFSEGDNDREEFAIQYFSQKKTEEFLKPLIKSKPTKSSHSATKRNTVTSHKAPVAIEKPKMEVVDKMVSKEDVDTRVDRFISRLFPKLPNSRINKLLRDKKVCISNSVLRIDNTA